MVPNGKAKGNVSLQYQPQEVWLDLLVVRCGLAFDLERIGEVCASPRAVQQNLRFYPERLFSGKRPGYYRCFYKIVVCLRIESFSDHIRNNFIYYYYYISKREVVNCVFGLVAMAIQKL